MRAVLVAATVLVAAALAVPGLADGMRTALLTLVDALRGFGHGTLDVGDGFVLAIAVALACAPLPLLVSAASRTPRPDGAWWHVTLSAVVVLLVATGAATRSDEPWDLYRSLALAGLVGVGLGALLGAAWRARGRAARASRRTRWIAWSLAAAYAVVVLLVATHATPVDGGIRPWLERVIAAAHRAGVPGWAGYDAVEITANVVFFVPFGVLVLLLFGARAWWAGMVGGLVVSCAIETVQALSLPARYASVNDVLANTSGAVLGVILGIVVLGQLRRE